MSTSELHGRIRSWLWLYEHIPFPPSNNPIIADFNARMQRLWTGEMLIDVALMEIPEELIGTTVELPLLKAIEYAKSKDVSKVSELRNLMEDVLKNMSETIKFENPSNHN